ncbi:nuclease domain-containing protein [Cavenderia fasciculata]|uniref:Nuclease domain-containing protein n=1 Tax=Cavenderia fasciculata TaxID=261658 RepID=F4QD88_CACFS|nr:nuclease domain-containing protein [Cavenderia fasciculata]EGG14559.1 nuclease domain-containing protein [Cavenderia fasciculata]|eukprot:XP_004366079.1 nuclease domain-containing protein [Cavenderia fasciculata]
MSQQQQQQQPTVSQIHPQKTIRGIVRGVNSGDSLTIQEVDTTRGELLTKQEYLLSSISAPRLGKPARNEQPATQDEPFAWESREHLRKRCIGKRVSFVIDYSVANGKPYITAFLVDDVENSINNEMVTSGWATLYKSKKPDQTLVQLESDAVSKELGVHNKNPAVLETAVRNTLPADNLELFNKLKGKKLNGIVENISKGLTTFKVTLPQLHNTLNVYISGVQVSRKEGENPAHVVEGEQLLNNNVLHRDVVLTLDTFDKSSNLIGSINCAGKDVAHVLLSNGIASLVPWSAATRSAEDQAALKEAEASAKKRRAGVWANYTPSAATASFGSVQGGSSASSASGFQDGSYPEEISGKVTEIDNTAQVTIQVALTNGGRRDFKVSMASIRVPVLLKSAEKDLKDKDAKFERYWAFEAKEFLRKKLVGQTVTAKLDFVRPQITKTDQPNLPEKPFYTIYFGKLNISVALAEAGLAKVNEYKGADNRAMDYESLVLAESKAKNSNKGLFSSKDSCPNLNINDVSTDDSKLKDKATKLLPHLKSATYNAVIDYVFSGQRYKVYIPKECIVINFSLAHVRAPKRGENAENDELSNQALLFSRELLHQRDVQVQIDDVDKGGNFLGVLYLNNKSHAITVVENGFATVNDPYGRSADIKALDDAENRAKSKRLNIWKSYDPEAERRAQEEAERQEADRLAKERAESQKEVTVSSILSATEVYVRDVSDASTELEQLLSKLDIEAGHTEPAGAAPKVGEVVNCKYDDGKWYRAKVLAVSDANKLTVQFYDYGNVSTTTVDKVRPLSHKFASLSPLSRVVHLAYVKANSNAAANEAAIDFMEEEFLSSIMTLQVQYKEDSGKTTVVLQDSQGSVNSELLKNGFVKFDRFARKGATYEAMQADQQHAKSKRLGIWSYGDAGSDDEDDFVRKPRGGGRRK